MTLNIRLTAPLLFVLGACSNTSSDTTSTPAPAAPPATATSTSIASAPATSSSATDANKAELAQMLKDFVEDVRVQLQLTDGQSEQLRAIFETHREQMSPHTTAIRSQPDRRSKMITAREHRDEMRAIQDSTDQKVQGVLDDKQYDQYVVLKEEFRAKMRAYMQENR